MKKFGLTLDAYQALYDEQQRKCAICSKEEPNRRLAVDHCHRTGKVRGLLCFNCNTALGKMDDNLELLKAAIAYLEKV